VEPVEAEAVEELEPEAGPEAEPSTTVAPVTSDAAPAPGRSTALEEEPLEELEMVEEGPEA
jgi:hypothetical protein